MQWKVVVGLTVIGVALAAVFTMLAPRYYDAKAVVHVSTIAVQEMEMGKTVTNTNLVWNRDLYVKTKIALIKSRSVRTKILKRYEELGLDDGITVEGKGVGLVGRSMDVKPRTGTELLDIVYTTEDPELSARLANITAQVLRDETLESTTDSALQAKTWLTDQINDLEVRIADYTRALLEYQRDNDMADVEDQTTTLGARMSSLKGAYGDANTDRVQYETMVRNHEEMLRKQRYTDLAKSMNTPMITTLTNRYAEALAEHARISAVFLEKMPERKKADQELALIEEELRAEVDRTLSAERAQLRLLREREQDLQSAISGGKVEQLDRLRRLEDYEKLRLDLESAKETFRRMKERMGELELQSKTQLNNIRIVEEARPPSAPSSPNVWMNLLLGLLGGLVLGTGAAVAREWFDDTITSPLDVSTYLRVPLLGTVPRLKTEIADEYERSLYTHLNPRSNAAEAIRNLRTVIELNPSGESPHRLLVTSAVAAEGKTSTALRLAIAYANLNRRVLLIDSDLRRPRIHKVFGGEHEPGFSWLITGEADYDEVIRPTPIPNLSYVAAGRRADRPAEILSSLELPGILDELDRRFDLVIIDSPPSGIVADARILSRHADAVLMMVKEHATSRVLVREAIRGLEQVGAAVMGVVLNEVDFTRQKYGYYYGYGYKYEGYFSEDDKDAAAK
ncbi:MAG: polysaccharide biosynthesis tyrosine autokinase [Alphaproteobacteria bacterium]|nr:polysaccharide biosynthesis tyrosine autokinase [Alphaproteobacteria bacterium]